MVTPVIILGLRRWQVLDVPNERSSHYEPTPRGGGLGVAVGVVVAVAAAASLNGTAKAAVIVPAVAFAALGLLEDFGGIPALRRLMLMFPLAIAGLPWLLEGLDGGLLWRSVFALGVIFWLVGYVNAYNFMDGINGIAAGQAAVAGVAWLVVGQAQDAEDLAVLGAIIAGASVAFLPFNFPRARVFLGDVGSYFVGAVLACTAVIGLRAGLPPEAVLAPLVITGADTGVTLIRRVLRRDRWYEPHCGHVYQRMNGLLGGSHCRTTPLAVGATALCAALGALSLGDSLGVRVAADAAMGLVVLGYLSGPRLLARVRKSEVGDLTQTPAGIPAAQRAR